ncbi:response regulator [Candidatus Microgenomates bacterium]|nr:response regulator [Candidatus Microgenomates bacterium]
MVHRLLLADDEAYTRELYEELLKGEGYDVVAVADGEAAFLEAVKGGFDLILLDIIMPKKDGVTFLKEYKTLKPQKPNGQIVMLSVLGEDAIIKTCLELGAAGFLIKSELTPDQVIKEVQGYLENPPIS